MAATITREQLNKLLEGIATSHWQVHTYGWGDVPDLLAREDVIYPFMMVTPQASVYGDNTINHTYTISIADRVLKDKENEVAVDSDTHQILMDVVTQLDNLLYDDVDLIKGITVTPFFDNFRHEVTGHFANVTVQVMYNYDACAIPSDNVVLPLPPPDVCLPASYRVQYENGTLIQEGTIPSGGIIVVDVPNIVPCADATWELRDSAGVLIDSGSIASGGSATITAPDGVVTITDSAAATLYVVNVKSDGTATQAIADSVVTLNNSAAGLISTTNVKAEDAATIVAPDGNITVNSVAFSTVESNGTENVDVLKSSGTDTVGSKQGTHWRIGDSTVNVNKSDGVLISARVVRAEETENYNVADSVIENSDSSYTANVKATDPLILPDQQIDVNTVNEGSIPSVGGIDINITDGVNPVTPNSVGIVGRTVTVEVPSGGGSFDVDLVDRFGNAFPTKQVTANATWDLRTLTPFDFADLYLNALSVTLSSAEEAAVIAFYTDMISAGLFQEAHKIDLYIGSNANDCSINARYPFATKSSNNSRFLGTPTFNTQGVVLSGTNCILTSVQPCNVNGNLRQVSFYNNIDVVRGSTQDLISTIGTNPQWLLRDNGAAQRIGFDSGNQNTVGDGLPYNGLVSLGRADTAAVTEAVRCRVDNVLSGWIGVGQGAEPLGEVVIGASVSVVYGITAGTPLQVGYLRIGDYLNDTQEGSHVTIVKTLMTALGR
jgi:hypothetical protein